MKTCFSKIATIVFLIVPFAGVAQSARLLTTFANPIPAAYDHFGSTVAAVGSDRVLVAAPNHNTDAEHAGAAYLFSTNGTLLTTITNPAPAIIGTFGRSAAVVGSDHVLIGAPYDSTVETCAGAVYLFNTNGTLQTTITNPAPADWDCFGWSVAAVGSDRVLIGALYDSTGATKAGAVYLFSTNGTLLTIITNPAPANGVTLGYSVAAMGSNRVLIGAFEDDPRATNAGAAYLFSTNGTLLTTFTNPAPATNNGFGWLVAAMGSDRVFVGAPLDSTEAPESGVAFLFSTNGTLLTTFTNPAPGYGHLFGDSMVAVGSDRVLIGSGGGFDSAAYLFTTNGALLTSITNPFPTAAVNNEFGNFVAVLGNDHVLIGAPYQGVAHLFSLEPFTPRLSVTHSGGSVIVSWPKSAESFVLDETLALAPPPTVTDWSQVPTATYQTNATNIFISLPAPTDNKFHRLRKP